MGARTHGQRPGPDEAVPARMARRRRAEPDAGHHAVPVASPGTKPRVAVLMGGANTERNVSLSSGLAVAHALRSLGYPVAELDSATPLPPHVDTDRLFSADEPTVASSRPVAPTAAAPPTTAELARLRAGQDAGVAAPGVLEACRAADVVFVTVFGDEGEAGATQAFLDRHGIAYTGPSADVCARSFDKARTKRVVAAHGVPSPRGHVVRAARAAQDLDALALPRPWIVKPVAGGSTLGLSHVTRRADLPAAVARATAGGCDALVEEFVSGRDFTIGVLDDRVFPVVEISTERALYDYAAKYQPGASSKRVPARLTRAEHDEVRRLTRTVHDALGIGATSSRSDFRRDRQGRFWFLEVNPLPGMTPTSSYPISAAADGVEFPQLCEALVRLAVTSVGGGDAGRTHERRGTLR